MVRCESARQNLVSVSTLDDIWGRHIVDSAQLTFLADDPGCWVDLGTGAGFPGLVVALLRQQPMLLVEARAKRAAFLKSAVEALGLSHVKVYAGRAETLPPNPFPVISARAFAPLGKLLAIGGQFANSATIWLLPRGRGAQAELEAASASWQGSFEMLPSVTDSESSILRARHVRPREAKRGTVGVP